MLVAKVMAEVMILIPKTRGEYIKITAKDRTTGTVGEYVLVYAGHLRIQLARVKVVAAIFLSYTYLRVNSK